MTAKDPYRYFRVEANDLIVGLGEGVMQLERGPAGAGVIEKLLRMAHTLKGAARVVKQTRIGELAHTLEELLGAHRGETKALASADANAMLALIDEAQALLALLDKRPEPPRPQPRAEVEAEQAEWLRVDTAGLEEVFRGIGAAATQSGQLVKHLTNAAHLVRMARRLELMLSQADVSDGHSAGLLATATSLATGLEELARQSGADATGLAKHLETLEEATHELILVQARHVFAPLARAVRDAADTTGRTVTFATHGGDVKLEADVLSTAREALMHLVRNAVAHGIEPTAERRAAGKPAEGRIELSVVRRSSRVRFEVKDDGRGLDVAAIAKAAVAQGRLAPESASTLDVEGAAALLLERGFSTKGQADTVSGRGIGLDVARQAAHELGGSLTLSSEPRRGTSIVLELPVSRSAYPCLVVDAGQVRVAIPVDAVDRALSTDALIRTGERLEAVLDGAPFPYAHLATLLGEAPRQKTLALGLRLGDRRAVLGVDRLFGTRQVSTATLPPWVEAAPIAAATWVDEEGHVRLVLDPAALIDACGAARTPNVTVVPRPPILVVDDSLTTRMLEKSILEAAGYEVDVAVSAEDGLLRAQKRRYGAFVVDVEMPGMDGYGFTRTICRDPDLRDIPVILVTSRGDPDDRKKGAEAGAKAHIAKGEFDQKHLLETMRKLMGVP